MSAPGSASSTPSRSRTIPRPPPSPNHPPPPMHAPVRPISPAPSTTSVSTLSAAATPRRTVTPIAPGVGVRSLSGRALAEGGAVSGASGGGSEVTQGTAEITGGRVQKARARDLLRKHYGLGVGPPPPLTGPGKPLDPMDIDSLAFDAKSYYEQLITTSSLATLLKKENELLSEIRQLDSERQSLVYNHHHELIAASDTISAMKTRAESIDSDLDKLRIAFSEISRLSDDLAVDDAKKD